MKTAVKKTNIELTDRDIELISTLAKFSVIKAENVGAIYQTAKYHEDRLATLKKAHYIRRTKGYVVLAVNGIRYAEEHGLAVRPAPTERAQRERVQQISDLYFDFMGGPWTFTDSRTIKEQQESFDRGSRILGLITGRTAYALYSIGKRPTQKKIAQIRKEQEKLYGIGINQSIVFYEAPEAREAYGLAGTGLKEHLLLPYPYGIDLIKAHGERDLIEAAALKAYGPGLAASDWKTADYSYNGTYVFVLVLNDIEKVSAIINYYTFAANRYTRPVPIEALCFEDQEEMFRAVLPSQCAIRTVAWP